MRYLNRRKVRILIGLWVSVVLCGFVVGCGRQAGFPDRPIVLLCPWAAGGGTDRISRQVAVQLERELGVPVNVVNATGGGGVTGHTRGAVARPDGYTVTMVTSELNMLHWRGLTNITYRDYRPVMLLNGDDAAIFVSYDAPWSTLDELEQAIRDNPGTLKGAGTAFGAMWHVSMAGWLNAIGLSPADVIWISMNGAAPSLQELMAGGVDLVCCSVPEAQTLLDAGRIRCLGVMADQRLPVLPNVPALIERGTDWTSRGWRGLAVPKDIPDERFEVLVEAARRVVTSDEYLDFLRKSGFRPAAEGPEAFQQYLILENEQYGEIFRSEAFRSVHSLRFGPMLFPSLTLGILVAALAMLLVTGGLRRSAEEQSIAGAGLVRAGLAVLFVVLYVALAEWIGFVITGAALLFLLLRALGVRWSVAGTVAIVLVPAVFQFFAVYMRVPLPWGWLGW